MGGLEFPTHHARVLLCIARDPDVRLSDIAASQGITDRSAYGIVTDLTAAGVRRRAERRPPQPLPDPVPLENRIRLVTGRRSVPQAACVYSLIRPLRRVRGGHCISTCITPVGILASSIASRILRMSHGIARRNSRCPDLAYCRSLFSGWRLEFA